MTDPLAIPPGPERSVWVFAIDLPKDPAEAFVNGPLAPSLGVDHVDAAQTEYLDADAFVEYGFARYLAEGQGVAEENLAADAATLDALRGPVLLVFRPALGQGRLSPRAPLRLIGRYDEIPAPPLVGMRAYDAENDRIPTPQKKRPSDAAMSGRVATVVLILLAIFVTLFIWGAS